MTDSGYYSQVTHRVYLQKVRLIYNLVVCLSKRTLKKVYKSNDLIEASYQLSVAEQRILLMCMVKIDSRKPMGTNREFKITAIEYSDTFGVPVKQAYEVLQDASESLYERHIKMIDDEGHWSRKIRWLQEKAVYRQGHGAISLVFSDRVKNELAMLVPPYTKYQLNRVSGLNSYYSMRIYEILIQFKRTGLVRISLEKFKIRLGLEDKYRRFADFKRRVIIPAVSELESKSNLKIDWFELRRGSRSVNHLEFRFEEKEMGS